MDERNDQLVNELVKFDDKGQGINAQQLKELLVKFKIEKP
jgi:hypothetical protein